MATKWREGRRVEKKRREGKSGESEEESRRERLCVRNTLSSRLPESLPSLTSSLTSRTLILGPRADLMILA